MAWQSWLPAAAALGGGVMGTFGGGKKMKPHDPDYERELRRLAGSQTMRLFYPNTDFGYQELPGFQPMPVMNMEASLSGTHPLQQQAINEALGFQPGQQGADVFQRAMGYVDPIMGLSGIGAQYSNAAMQSAAGALGNAYSRILGGHDASTEGLADYARTVAETQASNPYMDEMIQAANRDAEFSLARSRGAANAAAAGSGNTGSSRHAVANAIADQMAGNRMADVSAQMRGNAFQNAYDSAYGVAAQQALANQQAALAGTSQLGSMGMGLAGLGGQYLRDAGQFVDRAGNMLGMAGQMADSGDRAQLERIRMLSGMGAQERDIQNQLMQARQMDIYNRAMSPYTSAAYLQGQIPVAPGAAQMVSGGQNTMGNMLGGVGAGLGLYDWMQGQPWFNTMLGDWGGGGNNMMNWQGKQVQGWF